MSSFLPLLLLTKQKTIVQICIVLGITGLIFGLVAISSPFLYQNLNTMESKTISVVCERANNDCNSNILDASSLLSGNKYNNMKKKRHKVMGFVGIFTGFGSAGRRQALRQTWLPSGRDGLQRSAFKFDCILDYRISQLEEATGLAFRFMIGKTSDEQKMSALKEEVSQYDDFILLDLMEDYRKLPYKTLAFLKVAYALFDSQFYVKADDDIYLRPDRLSLLLTKERSNPRTYIGCMKNGIVFKNTEVKWFEPMPYLFGSQYFLHAYGPIYALSAKVVRTMTSISIDDFRMFGNEDVMIGAWMLAMNVNHEDNNDLCSNNCTSTSIAVWDKPKCSGLCVPEKSLLELHQWEVCSGKHTISE